jgi:hypothetical protein
MNATARWRTDAEGVVPARGRPEAQSTAGSARAHIRARLAALIGAFALEAQRAEILGAYDAIFRQSLDFPLGTRPPAASRLTEDGTPIQFATAVGAYRPSLRFIGDAGPLGGAGARRMRRARAAMEEVAGILRAGAELDALRPLLAALAPESDRLVLADPAGAFWIGAAFAPKAAAQMRIYVNGSWGSEAQRRARRETFAAHFGQSRAWEATEAHLPPALSPLGMALTLAPSREARGVFYFRAFGLRLEDYAALARKVAGAANAEAIEAFGTALLGEDARYPTASAVLSFGFGASPGLTVELEFCGHCLFRDDAEARRRLLGLFSAAGVDAGPYRTLVRHLLSGAPQAGPPRVHSFVGLSLKSAGPAYTLYMKPDLTLS